MLQSVVINENKRYIAEMMMIRGQIFLSTANKISNFKMSRWVLVIFSILWLNLSSSCSALWLHTTDFTSVLLPWYLNVRNVVDMLCYIKFTVIHLKTSHIWPKYHNCRLWSDPAALSQTFWLKWQSCYPTDPDSCCCCAVLPKLAQWNKQVMFYTSQLDFQMCFTVLSPSSCQVSSYYSPVIYELWREDIQVLSSCWFKFITIV